MRNQYYHARIEKIIEQSDDTRSFILDVNLDSRPGQFVMVWLPGFDEKPISLSSQRRITVKKVGPFTEKLFELIHGFLDVRGPYGNGFPYTGKSIAIGGGCGIAPLAYLLEERMLSGFVLAGKTKDSLIFLDDILAKLQNTISITEDGSYGIKGIATDTALPKSLNNYYICGPEAMMKGVADKLVADGIDPKKIYVNLERYMKCAVGICGNCSFSGYRVCSDGPVFRYDTIKDLPHFNTTGRARTGELHRFALKEPHE